MKIWAGIILFGRVIWLKQPEAFWLPGRMKIPVACLSFLQATQEEDGHWAQNMWLMVLPYWSGIQMDETALPILLMDLAWREKALTEEDRLRFWPMVRRPRFIYLRNGPISPQDRWEEDGGYTPFTIGAEIAALLVAAEMADLNNEAIHGCLSSRGC